MKTKYYAFSAIGDDTHDIGLFDTLEEADKASQDYRAHLTPTSRLCHDTSVVELSVIPFVYDLDSLWAYYEITGDTLEAVNAWTIYCLDELRELAYNLDYDEWYDPSDEEDCLDSLRTNWIDGKLTESAVMIVFEIIKARWEEDHRDGEV